MGFPQGPLSNSDPPQPVLHQAPCYTRPQLQSMGPQVHGGEDAFINIKYMPLGMGLAGASRRFRLGILASPNGHKSPS